MPLEWLLELEEACNRRQYRALLDMAAAARVGGAAREDYVDFCRRIERLLK